MAKPSQSSGGGLHIDRWLTGLYTNRAATSPAMRFSSIGQPIVYHDSLIDEVAESARRFGEVFEKI